MARVPVHFRDKLASEKTGVNSLDTSAADSARAITGMVDGFQKLAAVEVKKQVDSRKSAERTKALSAYSNDYLRANSETRKNNQESPEKFGDVFNPKLEEIRDEHLSKISDGRERSIMANEFKSFDAQQSIYNTKWEIEQLSVMAQQAHKDRVDQDTSFLVSDESGNSFENYETKIERLDDDRESFIKDFGLPEGEKYLKVAKDSMSNALITGMLNRGEVFEAAQVMKKPDFTNNVLDKTFKDLQEKVASARKGEKDGAAFRSSVNAVSSVLKHTDNVLAGNDDVAGMEEDINKLTFDIARIKKLDGMSPAENEVLARKEIERETLTLMRKSALERVDANASDDIVTVGKLKGRYLDVIKDNTLTGTVTELLNFKRDLEDARSLGRVKPETYKKWMTAVELVIDRDVLSEMSVDNNGKVSFDKGLVKGSMKRRLEDLFNNMDFERNDVNLALTTMEFYLDEVANKQVAGDINVYTPDAVHDEMMRNSKVKAQLKSMGQPVYLTVGDSMQMLGQPWNIKGFDQDGMAILEIVPVER